jgi:acyl carrier protein
MLNRKEILEILCDAIEISKEGISEDTVLEELGDAWDSVNRLSVISVIDTYAEHDIPSDAIVKSKTMGNLIDLICISSDTPNLIKLD